LPRTKGLLENQVIYNGLVFTRDKKTGYYLSAKSIHEGKRIRLHRYVWITEKGEIPEGYDVHHKDENKDDNDIGNLVLLNGVKHQKYHSNKEMLEHYDEYKERFMKFAQPAAAIWHGSEEGRAWHKEHWDNHLKKSIEIKVTKKCVMCGDEYQVSSVMRDSSMFCSKKCKAKHRRDSKVDDIEKKCIICGNAFFSNRYEGIVTCTRKCAAVIIVARREGREVPLWQG